MARPHKKGLSYFNLDVDFFEDEKIQFVSIRCGNLGELITIKLLTKIYRNGYYLKWGDDECALFSKKAGDDITKNLVEETVDELIKRGFFNKEIFDKYKVLTSKAIQSRFLKATHRRKQQSKTIKKQLMLHKQTTNKVNAYNNSVNAHNNSVNECKSTQSKVKKSKEQKNKQKKRCDFWSKLCKKFIKSTAIKRSNPPSPKRWGTKLKTFQQKEKIEKSRIKKVLLWYCSQFDKDSNPYSRKYLPKFVPQANSISGFLNKFYDIEVAMLRMTDDGTDPNKKNKIKVIDV